LVGGLLLCGKQAAAAFCKSPPVAFNAALISSCETVSAFVCAVTFSASWPSAPSSARVVTAPATSAVVSIAIATFSAADVPIYFVFSAVMA
jgi:hypothetical protein